MGDDTRLAFEHPEERAKATTDTLVDRISLRDHIVEAEIGAFQVERGVQQRMSFNIVVEVPRFFGAETDDVDDILSYDKVTEAISAELDVERLALLETLAERIAARILREPQALRVFLRIEKLDRGNGKLGVEIVREREEFNKANDGEEAVSPVIVHLTEAALRSQNLTGWISQIQASEASFVISVDMLHASTSADEITNRQIQLLAIEQSAWRLSELDPRCTVVATRTELDWGMKNNQISVWAPFKMVLDSTEGPNGDLDRPAALAGWLANQLNASKIVTVGQADPDSDLAVIRCPADVKELPL